MSAGCTFAFGNTDLSSVHIHLCEGGVLIYFGDRQRVMLWRLSRPLVILNKRVDDHGPFPLFRHSVCMPPLSGYPRELGISNDDAAA